VDGDGTTFREVAARTGVLPSDRLRIRASGSSTRATQAWRPRTSWPARAPGTRLTGSSRRPAILIWRRWLPVELAGSAPSVHFRSIAAGEVVLDSRDSALFAQLQLCRAGEPGGEKYLVGRAGELALSDSGDRDLIAGRLLERILLEQRVREVREVLGKCAVASWLNPEIAVLLDVGPEEARTIFGRVRRHSFMERHPKESGRTVM